MKLMGCKSFLDCRWIAPCSADWDLVQVERNCVIGFNCLFKTWKFENSKLILSKVTIESACLLQGPCIVEGGASLHEGCVVYLGSVVKKKDYRPHTSLSGNVASSVGGDEIKPPVPKRNVLSHLMYQFIFWAILATGASCGFLTFNEFAKAFARAVFFGAGNLTFSDFYFCLAICIGLALFLIVFGLTTVFLCFLVFGLFGSSMRSADRNPEERQFLVMVNSLVLLSVNALGGSVYASWFLEILGARHGLNCYIDPIFVERPDEVRMKDNCIVMGSILGHVDLGQGNVICRESMLTGTLKTGKYVTVLPNSVPEFLFVKIEKFHEIRGVQENAKDKRRKKKFEGLRKRESSHYDFAQEFYGNSTRVYYEHK